MSAHNNKMSDLDSVKSRGYKSAFKSAVKKVIKENNKEHFWGTSTTAKTYRSV